MDFFMMPGFMDKIRPEEKQIDVEYISDRRGSVESITTFQSKKVQSQAGRSKSSSSGNSGESAHKQVSLILSSKARSDVFSQKADPTQQKNSCNDKLLRVLEHSSYRFAINILIILSLVQFALAEYIGLGDTSNQGLKAVLISAIVNNGIFLVDLILHFVALGVSRTYKKMHGALIETVLQIVGIFALVLAIEGGFAD